MSDVLNAQAAAGVRSVRRETRAFLERCANEFAVIQQFYGRDVLFSSTDQNRVLAFEAALKGLHDATAADRPVAVPPSPAPAPVAVAPTPAPAPAPAPSNAVPLVP